MAHGRIEEPNIGKVVLSILSKEPHGRATVMKIKSQVPKHMALSPDDHQGSITRDHEELWEQQVRNLRSHKNTPGNVFCEGLIESVKRGVWQLTDLGWKKLGIKKP